MEYVLIVFSSLTTAKRVSSIAETKYGIKSKVLQTPKELGLTSCSYCIRVLEKDYKKIWEIIKSYNVYSKGIFKEKDYTKLI